MKISDPAAAARCYRALLDRSPEHVGAFYAAVKTTGIFCISTCRARKPKQANVDFFSDMREPLALGFRPCKVCRPTESSPDVPPQVERAMALVRAHPAHRVPDKELRALGLSPELIRRWFLKHHGHSFHAYQRMLRVNAAMTDLKEGRSTIDAALGSGYESLSGFAYTVKKMTGKAPSKAAQPLVMQRFSSPLGAMFVCASDKGVSMSGSSEDWDEIKQARTRIGGDFLWFRENGQAWYIQDAGLMAKVDAAWAPVTKLGKQMDAYGKEMDVHGKRMDKLGKEMDVAARGIKVDESKIRAAEARMKVLGEEMEALGKQFAKADDAERERLSRRMSELGNQMSAEGQRMGQEWQAPGVRQAQKSMDEIGRRMGEAGKPMDAIGKKMGALGKDMERETHAADKTVRALIREAQEKGLAKPVPRAG